MRFTETFIMVFACVYCLALFLSVGLHKYAWWKYSRGTSMRDPMFSSPASAIRFMKEPALFVKADGLKYEYWSASLLRYSTLIFLVGIFILHLLTGK